MNCWINLNASMNEWINFTEWIKKKRVKWQNEWVNGWMDEWIYGLLEWKNECVNESVNIVELMSGWISERKNEQTHK